MLLALPCPALAWWVAYQYRGREWMVLAIHKHRCHFAAQCTPCALPARRAARAQTTLAISTPRGSRKSTSFAESQVSQEIVR